jgi:hypothetical protein
LIAGQRPSRLNPGEPQTVEDVAPHSYGVDRATVRQWKTGRPVRFELTEQTRQSIDDYMRVANKKSGVYLFVGRRGQGGSSQEGPAGDNWDRFPLCPETLRMDGDARCQEPSCACAALDRPGYSKARERWTRTLPWRRGSRACPTVIVVTTCAYRRHQTNDCSITCNQDSGL